MRRRNLLINGKKYDFALSTVYKTYSSGQNINVMNPYNYSDPSNGFSAMEIDGSVQSNVVKNYTFSTTGEHTVKYELTNQGEIADYALRQCTYLYRVNSDVDGECNIPNGIASIGNDAFNSDVYLESVIIPSSVTNIGTNPWADCSYLESVTVDNNNPNYDSRNNCNAIIKTSTNELITGSKNAVIPNTVTKIGKSAFSGFDSITSINIPNSVTIIRDNAFYDCTSLTTTLPNALTYIGSNAFYNCQSLTSISFPSSLTSINSAAFGRCKNLTGQLYIPSTLTNIYGGNGTSSFFGNNFTSIVVDSNNPNYDSRNNCNAIIFTGDNDLYAGCKNTVIPNTVTRIGNYSFYGINGLTSITIPESVTQIRYCAFDKCNDLTSVTVLATTPPTIDSILFGGSSYDSLKIYVPSASVDTYKTAKNWKKYASKIEAIP